MQFKNRVLIVDDDPVNVEILEDILCDIYAIETARRGEEALHKVETFFPDVVLLDIMMPGMDGYEVCRRIRQNKAYKYVKVILVSAKAMIQERLQGYAAGADDYISKPFDHSEMLAKVGVFVKLKYEEEVDTLKNDLMHLLSHEKRTPLNSILGLSEVLLSTSKNFTEEERGYLEEIYLAGKTLLSHAEKTLMFCQLKKGFEIKKETFLFSELVKRTIELYAKESKKKQLTFASHYANDTLICADQQQMSMLLKIILENAVEYAPPKSEISIALIEDEEYLRLSVLDRGAGFKESVLKNGFIVFSENDVMHHTKGLGISLSLAQYIVKNHDGKIEISNGVNGGGHVLVLISKK